MTQLDRLEALAEKLTEVDWDFDELVIVNSALLDLIRIARAAKELIVRPESGIVPAAFVELQKALAPLFADVES